MIFGSLLTWTGSPAELNPPFTEGVSFYFSAPQLALLLLTNSKRLFTNRQEVVIYP
jgi:hypothetical protein